MKITDIKIGTRLGLLAGFLLCSMLVVGGNDWLNLKASNTRVRDAMERSLMLEHSVDAARKAQVDFKIQVQEWKDLLLRGNDSVAFEKYLSAFKTKGEETQKDLNQLAGLLDKLGLDTKQVTTARQSMQELNGKYIDAIKSYDIANQDSAHIVDRLVKGMDRAPTKQIGDIVTYVLDQSERLMKETNESQLIAYQRASLFSLLGMLIAFCLGSVVTYYFVVSIIRPLARAVHIAKTVASGDLSNNVDIDGKDETADLLSALREMTESLTKIVNEVRNGTEMITTASTQIATGNLDLSSRTEQQAGSLEETASAMEELTSTVKHNSDNTKAAQIMANRASDVAQKGGAVVGEVISTMGSINESSKKIVDIIAVIDGIAFQTNILALNAAVEAARAGEQGRGFAVVASEVRNLAQRSASAAKEIKTLINDSVEKVGIGGKLVDQAGATMQEVVASVQRLTTVISEIANANQEQSSGLNQINTAIIDMDSVTQQNSALVEEAAAAAASMQNQAILLEQVVSQFKLRAISGHLS
ncbi:HAMP domain-containing protein [Undibacterium jejuense]|uniref:HAMP domain-containing protein n=1 Tax=Undibacterium jejuense TaxID=1344949 RepID=A0A923KQ12_9BURK|nr:methyl-accepting chemotaxis protein [Undibacterium jejuense]MBC3862331.1 HAMP domain-containing protein [Undibacterium jejuense]